MSVGKVRLYMYTGNFSECPGSKISVKALKQINVSIYLYKHLQRLDIKPVVTDYILIFVEKLKTYFQLHLS